MKFTKPKNGVFTHYCFECDHWKYVKSVGAAHLGVCRGIVSEPTEEDAYGPPCGLFRRLRLLVEGGCQKDG